MKEKFKVLVGVLTVASAMLSSVIIYVQITLFMALLASLSWMIWKNREIVMDQSFIAPDFTDLIFLITCISASLFVIQGTMALKACFVVFSVIATVFRRLFKRQPTMSELFNN